jgi:hypothetical protein
MGLFTFKKIIIPSGETQELTAYESWTVRWLSRHGYYSSDTRTEVEVFTNEEDANAFAEELRNAFKLIKHTSGITVKVEKN